MQSIIESQNLLAEPLLLAAADAQTASDAAVKNWVPDPASKINTQALKDLAKKLAHVCVQAQTVPRPDNTLGGSPLLPQSRFEDALDYVGYKIPEQVQIQIVSGPKNGTLALHPQKSEYDGTVLGSKPFYDVYVYRANHRLCGGRFGGVSGELRRKVSRR